VSGLNLDDIVGAVRAAQTDDRLAHHIAVHSFDDFKTALGDGVGWATFTQAGGGAFASAFGLPIRSEPLRIRSGGCELHYADNCGYSLDAAVRS